jgi:hypothetical protein
MSSKRSSQHIPKPIKFLDEIGHDVQQVSEIASKTARLQGEKRSLKAIKVEPVMGPTTQYWRAHIRTVAAVCSTKQRPINTISGPIA